MHFILYTIYAIITLKLYMLCMPYVCIPIPNAPYNQLSSLHSDVFEMKSLASFPPSDGVSIVSLFKEGGDRDKDWKAIRNKSAYLAAIMKRYAKAGKAAKSDKGERDERYERGENPAPCAASPQAKEGEDPLPETIDDGEDDLGDGAGEGQGMLEGLEGVGRVEGVERVEGAEGADFDEIDRLTALPVEADSLLYALAVCAPYSAMKNFKYKVSNLG